MPRPFRWLSSTNGLLTDCTSRLRSYGSCPTAGSKHESRPSAETDASRSEEHESGEEPREERDRGGDVPPIARPTRPHAEKVRKYNASGEQRDVTHEQFELG